ncbi:MAG: hypothetical protein HY809_10355 [Nitrospirae bacterium]|nr:hypothetical protein [Nitrospirota bacterium]
MKKKKPNPDSGRSEQTLSKIFSEIPEQAGRIWPAVIIILIIASASAALLYIVKLNTGMRLPSLTSDPARITNTKFFVGILSNIGIMFWSAAAGICFFSAAASGRKSPHCGFLLSSGFFTLFLMLDDALMFHERVFPTYFKIPEAAVYIGYLAAGAVYMLLNFRRILSTDYLLFALAILFLGASAGADQFIPSSDMEIFAEDILKFTGILFWLAYFSFASVKILRND